MVDWQSESDLDSIRNSCDVLDMIIEITEKSQIGLGQKYKFI